MRFERRPGLAQRRRAIDRGGGRTQSHPADIGQHVAALVIEHYHRTVAHPARTETLQLMPQRIAGERLHRRIERGGYLHPRRGQQVRSEVWCARRIEAVQPPHARGTIGQCAQCRAIGGREQAAGARGEHGGRCCRIAQQCGEQRRLAPVELVGALAEQRQGRRAHPLRLAAERCEIEVGLKDLVLAPAVLEAPRGAHLAQLVEPPARARTADLGPQKSGGLHGDGRGPPTARALCPVAHRSRQRQPVDPAVAGETVILGQHPIALQFGADRAQRGPRQPPHREIEPHFVEQPAILVVKPGLARFPVASEFGEVGSLGRRRAPVERYARQHQRCGQHKQHSVTPTLRQVG